MLTWTTFNVHFNVILQNQSLAEYNSPPSHFGIHKHIQVIMWSAQYWWSILTKTEMSQKTSVELIVPTLMKIHSATLKLFHVY
jgi:hypothetical protein